MGRVVLDKDYVQYSMKVDCSLHLKIFGSRIGQLYGGAVFGSSKENKVLFLADLQESQRRVIMFQNPENQSYQK